MSIFDVSEADLGPLRNEIIEAAGVSPDTVAGFIVIVCTSEDGVAGAGLISSSPHPRTIVRVLEKIAAELRRQLSELS